MGKWIAEVTNIDELSILSYPDYYLDPRDFHEAILKTSLEAKKITLPKIAKKHKERIGVGYVSLTWSVIDVRFIIITTQLLLQQWYDGICVIACDYSKSYFERERVDEQVFQTTFSKTKQLKLPKKDSFGTAKGILSLEQSYLLHIAQSLFPITSCIFFTAWTQLPENYNPWGKTSKEFLAIDRMMEYIHNQKNHAIIVIGEHEEELQYNYNASRVFEAIVTTLERTVKKTSFDSALGELTLFFW